MLMPTTPMRLIAVYAIVSVAILARHDEKLPAHLGSFLRSRVIRAAPNFSFSLMLVFFLAGWARFSDSSARFVHTSARFVHTSARF